MASTRAVVPVNIPGTRYDVTIAPGLLSHAGEIVRQLTPARRVGVVVDSRVGPLHLARLADSLTAVGIDVVTHTVPAGEHFKTIVQVALAYDTFLAARIERSTPLLALGGGVVGDLTGFVAATLLRGVPFVQVPTSLLAMVDASVGGKTGVNHAVGKNLIGSFHQPIAVLIDPQVLATLPPRELRGGLAECIKHDLIRDSAGFARLERDIGRALALDIDYLAELVAHNVAIKARVVEADPFEKGERAHLNFGHTFGHAIESLSKYEYSHGESVALGMTAAAHLSAALGLIGEADRRRIVATIAKAGLPTGGMVLDTAEIVDSMAFDKKVKAGRVRFVLLDGIGRAVVRDDVPPALVRDAVESLKT